MNNIQNIVTMNTHKSIFFYKMNPHAVEIIQAIGGEVLPAFSTPRLVFATGTEEQYEDLVGRISLKSSNCFGDTDVTVVQVFDF